MLPANAPTERDALLAEHAEKQLIRLVVAGSVDDGKSTLIGRLLYECDGLFDDQIAAVRATAQRRAGGAQSVDIDFALFTDGLEAEREQGITIDVAYRYLTTDRRKLVIADTPGHLQYTRNMATGASTADACIILVDATRGVLAQTRRHAYIAALLGIPRVLLAVNKLDLVHYDEDVYRQIKAEFGAYAAELGFDEVVVLPVSGRQGDNVASKSPFTPWHAGGTLVEWIESLPNEARHAEEPLRLAVQTVLRPNAEYRGFAGQIASGTLRPGDAVVVLPSGKATRVASIDGFDGPVLEAQAPASVAIRLTDDIDIARGDLLASPDNPPVLLTRFEATLVWFSDKPLEPGRVYRLKQLTRTVPATLDAVVWRKDLETLTDVTSERLGANDIGRVRVTARQPLVADPYRMNRRTGAFIVIDEQTNDTVAAGMIEHAIEPPALVLIEGGNEPAPTPSPAVPPPPVVRIPALATEKSVLVAELARGVDRDGLQWLSGYFAGLAAAQGATLSTVAALAPVADAAQAPTTRATVLYGSQTGNSRNLATRLHATLEAGGYAARLLRTGEYALKELADETLLYVVISTQGDGEPPDDALSFVEHVMGRRAPKLPNLRYAVLGLGDSSYPKFCETGRQLDERFSALGAKRLLDRVDVDVDFEEPGAQWISTAFEKAPEALGASVQGVTPTSRAQAAEAWTRERPFEAEVLEVQRIVGRDAIKDVRHVELSLEGSGLTYEPGDSLGIWPTNPAPLVAMLVEATGLDGQKDVTHGGKTLPFETWLLEELEVTKASRPFIQALRERSEAVALDAVLGDAEALRRVLETSQIIDLVRAHPASWTEETFVRSLRKLTPRLYSIASSQKHVGDDEVHLTVAVVDYELDGFRHYGAASTHLALAREGERVRVFVEPNDRFRLPADDRDIILIGPGTGVAPFRAFLQERVEREASGRTWLFFGEQHFRSQFLYQVEWQEALRKGHLARLSLAFSRDQKERIYVQQRMREAGEELFRWLENGAHVYVCGDANRMAPDVHDALLDVIRTHGERDDEGARAYLDALRASGRYSRDVY